MKNKLINIKNFLRIVISLMVIVSMSKTCAKALTYDEIKDYVNQTADYYSSNSAYQTCKSLVNNNTQIINALRDNASNFSAICIGKHYSVNNYYFGLANFTSVLTNGNGWSGSGQYLTIEYGNGSTYVGNITNFTNSTPNRWGDMIYMQSSSNQYNRLTAMCYENFENYTGTIGLTYVGKEHLAPLINIYFGHLFSTTITLNNEEMQANELDYNYRIEFVENVVTEDNEITSMQATLGTLNLECQDLGSYWTLICNNSTQLQYDRVYDLIVSAIVNGNEEEIEEKVIFVPPGTTITGGVITNIPSGDYNFNTENATNQIIENINNLNNALESGNQEIINNINNSSEVDNIMGEYTSGDIETISSDLGFSTLDNPFTSFLFFVIEGVYDVLTEREDIVLSTHYKNFEINLASTDFTIPQNELKTFIRNMLVCVYIYGNYKWFHYMITLLETAKINKFIAEIGTDEFYDTDIM